jgi:hypothetical protein
MNAEPGLQLGVAVLAFPPLVVEGREVGGWCPLVIQQGGGQAERLDPGGAVSSVDCDGVLDDPHDVALGRAGRDPAGGAGLAEAEVLGRSGHHR